MKGLGLHVKYWTNLTVIFLMTSFIGEYFEDSCKTKGSGVWSH